MFAAIALSLAACSANPDKQVARDAASAMTGSPETVTAVNSLVLDGRGERLQPAATIAAFHESFNFRRRQWRIDMTRFDGSNPPEFGVQVLNGKIAFDQSARGPIQEAPSQVELRRAELYHHPIGFLFTAFLRGSKLSNARHEAEWESVDMMVDSTVYTLFINPADKLPIRIASRTSDGKMIETLFSGYKKFHGYAMPTRFERKVDGATVFTLEAPRQFTGPEIDLSVRREVARN